MKHTNKELYKLIEYPDHAGKLKVINLDQVWNIIVISKGSYIWNETHFDWWYSHKVNIAYVCFSYEK